MVRLGANFSWTETGGTRGTMVAQLDNGQVFQGPFFQITSGKPSRRLRAAVERLGTRLGLGPWLGRPMLGLRAGAAGVHGVRHDETITHYSGQVLANLQGPGGFMRCDFTSDQPELGNGGRRRWAVPASRRDDHRRSSSRGINGR